MADTQISQRTRDEIAQLSSKEVLLIWRSERAKLFNRLNKKDGISMLKIGKRYNCTRQNVSKIIDEGLRV